MKTVKKTLCLMLALVMSLTVMNVAFAAESDASEIIETSYGKVKGKSYDGGMCYFGIPYAKATTGIRRFTPPEAPEKWEGVLDATKHAKDPIQSTYSKTKQSEDSLKVSIWVPDTAEEKPLSVMFWIYGGSYAFGGVDESYYDMSQMANDTGCIIVSANYRLNVCGFLDLRDVVDGATANNGLRDIVFALKWVNENISAFGGNPDNVTVFGQSAGGALANALLAVPSAEPYFHKIISQSACGDSFYSPSQAKEVTARWLDLMGNPSGDDLISMSAKKLVSKNGAMDTKNIFERGIDCTFNPVIDGEFLTCHPSEVPKDKMNKKLLLGCTKDEAALFLFFVVPPLNFIPLASDVAMPDYPDELKEKVTQGIRYPSTKSLITLTTERMYRYPLMALADNYSEKSDVYVYRYDYEPFIVKLLNIGVFHITEIPILFNSYLMLGSLKIQPFKDSKNQAVGSRMRAYWGNFAKYGCPGENWTAYSRADRATLLINETDSIVNDPYGERMKLYETYVSPWKR